MIFTLIAGFVVGVFFGSATPFIQTALERLGIALDEQQLSLASLALCLALAGLLLGLIGVKSFPFLLCFAAACGIVRKPLLARFTSQGS